jgi:hypothetical protein
MPKRLARKAQAFAPGPSFFSKNVTFGLTSTTLEACRMNAQKEKIKRNRENMRKFRPAGKLFDSLDNGLLFRFVLRATKRVLDLGF